MGKCKGVIEIVIIRSLNERHIGGLLLYVFNCLVHQELLKLYATLNSVSFKNLFLITTAILFSTQLFWELKPCNNYLTLSNYFICLCVICLYPHSKTLISLWNYFLTKEGNAEHTNIYWIGRKVSFSFFCGSSST